MCTNSRTINFLYFCLKKMYYVISQLNNGQTKVKPHQQTIVINTNYDIFTLRDVMSLTMGEI